MPQIYIMQKKHTCHVNFILKFVSHLKDTGQPQEKQKPII